MRHKIKFDKIAYLRLRELGTKLNLSFTNFLTLGTKVIGLDVMKRKLLVAENNDNPLQPHIIELDKISAIGIQKIYNSIKAGDLKRRKIGEFLQSIHLQLETGKGANTMIIPFYERKIDDLQTLPGLEGKARNWQTILSKLLQRKTTG